MAEAPFRILVSHPDEPREPARELYVYQGPTILLSLRYKRGRRWVWCRWWKDDAVDEDVLPPAGLVEWLHQQAEEMARHGFLLRRWWHLHPCRDCGAAPLALCLHLRKQEPISSSHPGRKPRPGATFR